MKQMKEEDGSSGHILEIKNGKVEEKDDLIYLDAPQFYTCAHCRTHLANHDDFISKAFQGRHGPAYLFDQCINVRNGPAEDRMLNSGLHSVCDIHCKCCCKIIGWFYSKVFEPTQKYKEGKYILEKIHLLDNNNKSLNIFHDSWTKLQFLVDKFIIDLNDEIDSEGSIQEKEEVKSSLDSEMHGANGTQNLTVKKENNDFIIESKNQEPNCNCNEGGNNQGMNEEEKENRQNSPEKSSIIHTGALAEKDLSSSFLDLNDAKLELFSSASNTTCTHLPEEDYDIQKKNVGCNEWEVIDEDEIDYEMIGYSLFQEGLIR